MYIYIYLCIYIYDVCMQMYIMVVHIYIYIHTCVCVFCTCPRISMHTIAPVLVQCSKSTVNTKRCLCVPVSAPNSAKDWMTDRA